MAMLTGHAAIEYVEVHGGRLCKHADPIEGARDDLTTDEARAVAREDPQLVYVELPTVSSTALLSERGWFHRESARLRARRVPKHDRERRALAFIGRTILGRWRAALAAARA